MFQVPLGGKEEQHHFPPSIPPFPCHLVLPQGQKHTHHIFSFLLSTFELLNGAQEQELSAAFPSLVTGFLNCLYLFPMELQCCPQKLKQATARCRFPKSQRKLKQLLEAGKCPTLLFGRWFVCWDLLSVQVVGLEQVNSGASCKLGLLAQTPCHGRICVLSVGPWGKGLLSLV